MAVELVEMDDGAILRTWRAGSINAGQHPVVMINGGPGLPDYLASVADFIDDLTRVHRYDQRGTGGSGWRGVHTIERHVHDLELLLEAWGYDRVILVGHSYGTDLASFFLLAHPDRVAGIVYLAGPFFGDWRDAYRAAQRERRSAAQQARLDELDAVQRRSEAEEIEFLTLSWFTDHSDQARAWDWATEAARERRPVNYEMNSQLNFDKRVDPLELCIERLRADMPPGAAIIGGAGDSRPAEVLRQFGAQIGCEVVIIPGAGHSPWLERPDEFRSALRAAVENQLYVPLRHPLPDASASRSHRQIASGASTPTNT
jgi:pimeloyl-ACP methyl ester carboxylesterase